MRPIIVLLVLALVVSATSPLAIVSAEDSIKPLYDNWKPIPDNLPWYPIGVFGDNRPSDVNQIDLPEPYYRIIEELRNITPIAIIGTGDHTGRGTTQQIDKLAATLQGLENVWLALGNHDLNDKKVSYWKQVIGPENYYRDDIPGWRIVIVNCDMFPVMNLRNTLTNLLNVHDRYIILVVHRPLYPDVDHNLEDAAKTVVENAIRTHPNIKIVLQGHWHGYAVAEKAGIEYIVTGGAGAPLYSWPSTVPGAKDVVKLKYHYIVMILYPNGTYVYKPISLVGRIQVIRINETAYKIVNTKKDLHNEPTWMPVRINYTINGKTYYVVLKASYGTTIVNYKLVGDKVAFYTNSSDWYVYTLTSNPEEAEVYSSQDMLNLWMATTTSKTPESTTPTTSQTPSTTTGETTSNVPEEGSNNILLYAGIAIAVVIVVAALVLFTRKK